MRVRALAQVALAGRRRVRPAKLVCARARQLSGSLPSAPADRTTPSRRSRRPSESPDAARSASRGSCCRHRISSRRSVTQARSARAAEVLSEFEERSDAVGRVSASAAAARCRGILGDVEAFERALELHDRVPTPFERARTELCYGESLRRSKRRSEARELLRSALDNVRRARGEALGRARAGGATGERRTCPAAHSAARHAHRARARRRTARRRRPEEPRGSGAAVRLGEDDRVPPRERLSEARRAIPRRAGALPRLSSAANRVRARRRRLRDLLGEDRLERGALLRPRDLALGRVLRRDGEI